MNVYSTYAFAPTTIQLCSTSNIGYCAKPTVTSCCVANARDIAGMTQEYALRRPKTIVRKGRLHLHRRRTAIPRYMRRSLIRTVTEAGRPDIWGWGLSCEAPFVSALSWNWLPQHDDDQHSLAREIRMHAFPFGYVTI
jgi:hypothetical protein